MGQPWRAGVRRLSWCHTIARFFCVWDNVLFRYLSPSPVQRSTPVRTLELAFLQVRRGPLWAAETVQWPGKAPASHEAIPALISGTPDGPWNPKHRVRVLPENPEAGFSASPAPCSCWSVVRHRLLSGLRGVPHPTFSH